MTWPLRFFEIFTVKVPHATEGLASSHRALGEAPFRSAPAGRGASCPASVAKRNRSARQHLHGSMVRLL
jgi:hypothetical protein